MTTRLFRRDLGPPAHPLIDVHVHLGTSDTGEIYYPNLAAEEYLDLMDVTGIDHACAFPPQRSGYAEANDRMRALGAASDGRLLAFARLGGDHVPVTLPALWQVRRKLRAKIGPPRSPDVDSLDGFAGVKCLPHLDGLPDRDVLREISDRSLPILVHGGVHVPPAWIERHILQHVSSPVIIGHLGSFPAGERELRAAVDLAGRHDRVYLETSGAWLSEFVRLAADAVPDRVVFGSDAPLAHPLVAWHHVASVVHDDDLLERIGLRWVTCRRGSTRMRPPTSARR